MRVIDVDAHFHEPANWLAVASPALAGEIGPLTSLTASVAMAQSPIGSDLPIELQPEDRSQLITPEFRAHLRKTDKLQPERYISGGGDPMYDAAARCRLCDEIGVDVQ